MCYFVKVLYSEILLAVFGSVNVQYVWVCVVEGMGTMLALCVGMCG